MKLMRCPFCGGGGESSGETPQNATAPPASKTTESAKTLPNVAVIEWRSEILPWAARRRETKRPAPGGRSRGKEKDMDKWKDVSGYVNGKKVAKNLLALAVKQNKMLVDVKKELRERFPEIVFKVEYTDSP
jgi:hypothetical protein